jgi:hypothetical protein
MNLLIEQLARMRGSRLFVRYEDMVDSPRQALAQIAEFVAEPGLERGLPPTTEPLDLGVNHTVSGNPVRFEARSIRLKPDTEWQTRMKPAQKAVITVMTWPHLMRYGYLKAQPRPDQRTQPSEAPVTGDAPIGR